MRNIWTSTQDINLAKNLKMLIFHQEKTVTTIEQIKSFKVIQSEKSWKVTV